MKTLYTTQGTCARSIEVEVEEGLIKHVSFDGGCHGNTQGICALVKGMSAAEAIARLEGIRCKDKPTSYPDQLAKALKSIS